MSIEVKIPSVGESIPGGVLSKWHQQDGSEVKSGDLLFTLETDKISTEVAAENDGILQIKVAEETEVKIGEVVALIEEDGGGGAKAPEPAPKTVAREMDEKDIKPFRQALRQAQGHEPSRMAQGPEPVAGDERMRDETPKPPPVPASAGEGRFTRKKLSPLRLKIAAQLVMAQQNAAILTTFNECDMSALMKIRAGVQETFQKKHGVKLGLMSFFIKGAIAGLKEIPAINGRMEGGEFIQNHYYDIGVAVGTERGLIVPVIHDADQKSLARIEKDLAEYSVKAREGKMKIEDLQGGVFTISNGGVYGSLLSTPILNPPQSGILGMHKIQQRPIALDGRVVIRPMMYLALSYDHRVVDGKDAVAFLIRVKECIESPALLLMDM